jgi:type I restriction enzyme, S subunit
MTKYPKDWVVTSLEAIGSIKSGGTPLRSEGAKYFSLDGISWVKTMDLNNGYIEKTDEKITKLAIKESACSVFPKDTVLVAMYGGFNQIGRTGILAMEAAINQAISAVILKSEIAIPAYVIYWLNANVLKWRQFAASSRKDPNITRKDVCEFPIVLPPLREQCRIAEILGIWDESIDLLEKLITAKHKLKQGIMQQLLTGKKRFKKYNGSKWGIKKLKDIGKISSGGTPDTNNPDYWNGNIPWCTPSEITALKDKYINYTGRTISENGIKSSSTAILPMNSLLVCTRATIGYCAINTVPMCTNQGFKNLIPNNLHSVVFLYYKFQLEKYQLLRLASGSTFLEISKKDFEIIEFNVPSLPEQEKIAAVLSAVDAEISTLEKQLAAYKQQKRGLMQQLLTGRTRILGLEDGQD